MFFNVPDFFVFRSYLGGMEKDLLEKAAACALLRTLGYEPSFGRALIEAFGNAGNVFAQDRDTLREAVGPNRRVLEAVCRKELDTAALELERLEKEGYLFLAITDPAYPALLKECRDAPVGLYVRASSDPSRIFRGSSFVSVVGTRDISSYGSEWCPKIIEALASASEKPTIVSGLAFGVDISAHMAALAYGLPTIAVLPVGIDSIYPAAHRTAAAKIAGKDGCALITDYPPGTAPLQLNFLRRNRIIAGMSRACILVESKLKGGGTMTARLASGYGRDVFALPGRIDDLRSQGCNLLLREKIAEPLTSLAALPTAIGLGTYNRRRTSDLSEAVLERYGRTMKPEEAEQMAAIIREIRAGRDITPDELCARLQIGYSDVMVYCGLLENDGFITMDLLRRCRIVPKIA